MLCIVLLFTFPYQKGECRVFQGNKARQVFRKMNTFYPLIRTRTQIIRILYAHKSYLPIFLGDKVDIFAASLLISYCSFSSLIFSSTVTISFIFFL